MANNKRDKVNPDLLNKAKALYLAGESVSGISKDLEIPRSTLNYHIKQSWLEEKTYRATQMLETVSNLHLTTIQTMTKNALIAAARAAEHLATRAEPPTSKEMMDCASVIDKISIISERFKSEEDKERERNQAQKDVVAIDPFGAK